VTVARGEVDVGGLGNIGKNGQRERCQDSGNHPPMVEMTIHDIPSFIT
jgi:hypothetical protein